MKIDLASPPGVRTIQLAGPKMPKSFKIEKLYDEVLKRQETSRPSNFYNVHAERALILRERQAAMLLQKWIKAYPLARSKRRAAKVGCWVRCACKHVWYIVAAVLMFRPSL